MNLKPIEPGCLAVVIGSVWEPNNGKVVRVKNYLGRPVVLGFLPIASNWWEIDGQIMIVDKRTSQPMGLSNMCRQENLLRIDGDSFEHEEESEQSEQPHNTTTSTETTHG